MKREYPDHPVVGVGAVVVSGKRVLLIRRGREPLKGQWSIPGGMVELGESLIGAMRREVKEETGLKVEPLKVVSVFDRIQANRARVQYHYVIIDYVCRRKGGRLKAGSDALDARWVNRQDLARYHLSPKVEEVIAEALHFSEQRR
jgi:8-oxo-dGTP diphosphatase